MKTVAELLREADPLTHELTPSEQRLYQREAILAAASRTTQSSAGPSSKVTRVLALGFAMVVIWFIAARVRSPLVSSVYAAPVRFEVRLAEETPVPGSHETKVPGTDRSVYVYPEAIVTNSDISRAYVVQVHHSSRYNVGVDFNPAGAEKIRAATAKNIGKQVAILLDGRVVMTATVRDPIGESAIISGDLSKSDAERIVRGITKIR